MMSMITDEHDYWSGWYRWYGCRWWCWWRCWCWCFMMFHEKSSWLWWTMRLLLCSNSQRNPKHVDHQLGRLTGGVPCFEVASSVGCQPSINDHHIHQSPETLPSCIVAQEESRWKSKWTGGRAQFSQIEAIISSRLTRIFKDPFLVGNLDYCKGTWGPMAYLWLCGRNRTRSLNYDAISKRCWYEKLNPFAKQSALVQPHPKKNL